MLSIFTVRGINLEVLCIARVSAVVVLMHIFSTNDTTVQSK